ncbi:hypothetical protein [Candidatus Entotheonella palauensis]|uniref:hypothetical protein n=1 Tax=Candidatus Entotheonella palauensis TaxID=93172 RepID=UPI000B7E5DB4|nr:hypothetical protein [Candidatus Entotheonella palauensis]
MTDHDLSYPTRDINLTLRACNPAEPLPPGDQRWYDFRTLRGGSVVEEMQRILRALPVEGDFHHRVLCGHRGSGKSTELLYLKQWADQNGFLTVRIEVDVHLGMITPQFSDLYLLTAMAVEDAMQRDIGRPLPARNVRQVVQWFAEVTQEDRETVKSELAVEAGVQLNASIPLLGKLFGKFCSAIKAGSQHAEIVRQRLRNFPDTLIDQTNELLRTANETLSEHQRPRGVLLLFDNLDRYEVGQIDSVLVRGASLMRRLASHAIFVIPIGLEYAPPSGPIQDEYSPSFVLPMLALRRHQDGWQTTVEASSYNEAAINMMLESLEQRLVVDELFDDPADAVLLVKMSGGCVRDLMHLVTLAFQQAGDTFSHPAVMRAIQQYRATFARRLTPEDYARLAQIAHRESVPRDALTARLLHYRYALEYTGNGGSWMDVHPLIVEIEEFGHAFTGQRLVQG